MQPLMKWSSSMQQKLRRTLITMIRIIFLFKPLMKFGEAEWPRADVLSFVSWNGVIEQVVVIFSEKHRAGKREAAKGLHMLCKLD